MNGTNREKKAWEVSVMDKYAVQSVLAGSKKKGIYSMKAEWKKNWLLYSMFLSVAVYYLLFAYKPMYGALIAFQDYEPMKGIAGS